MNTAITIDLTAELETALNDLDAKSQAFDRLSKEYGELLAEIRNLTDQVDMNRDEFLRIKVCCETLAEGNHSGAAYFSEIAGLCERAQIRIKQRVPVIQQNVTLEKENARLNALVKTQAAYIDSIGAIDPISLAAECKKEGGLDPELMAWTSFCRLHPHEAHALDPERFFEFFQTQCPGKAREFMEATLRATAACPECGELGQHCTCYGLANTQPTAIEWSATTTDPFDYSKPYCPASELTEEQKLST